MEGFFELRAHFANPLAARFLPTEGIVRAQQGMKSSSCNRSQVKHVATRIGQPMLGAPAHVLSARAVRVARVLPDTHGRPSSARLPRLAIAALASRCSEEARHAGLILATARWGVY